MGFENLTYRRYLKFSAHFLFPLSAGHTASSRESSFVFHRTYMHQIVNHLHFPIIYLIFIQWLTFQ